MRRTVRRVAGACLAALLSIVASGATAGEIAGYVVDYSGDVSASLVRRAGGATLPVRVGQALEAGDQLVVTGDAAIVVEDGTGPRTLKAGGSPFAMREAGVTSRILAKYVQIMEIVRWQAQPATVSARTRDGGRVEVPMLEGPSVRIFEGRRRLLVGWLDGRGPFRWQVFNNGRLVAEAGSADRRWIEIPVDLAKGRAELRVTGAEGSTRTYPAEVEAAGPGPAPDTPLGRIAHAVALSRRADGAYSLEAVQALSTANASRAETALRDALRLGERP